MGSVRTNAAAPKAMTTAEMPFWAVPAMPGSKASGGRLSPSWSLSVRDPPADCSCCCSSPSCGGGGGAPSTGGGGALSAGGEPGGGGAAPAAVSGDCGFGGTPASRVQSMRAKALGRTARVVATRPMHLLRPEHASRSMMGAPHDRDDVGDEGIPFTVRKKRAPKHFSHKASPFVAGLVDRFPFSSFFLVAVHSNNLDLEALP